MGILEDFAQSRRWRPAVVMAVEAVSSSSTSLTLLLALLLAFWLLIWRKQAIGSQLLRSNTLLCPGSLPLIGNLHTVFLNRQRLHDWLLDITIHLSGRTWVFTTPLKEAYFVVTNPAVLEHVLKTNFTNYIKGKAFADNIGPLLGHGIFTADGEDWRWQRKLASNMFSVRR